MPTDFKKLMSARFLFTFATQMQSVILGWRIYELLRDPLYLGFIGLAEAIPAIGLALYAGYLVDRARPVNVYKNVMYVSLVSGVVVLAENVLQLHLPLAAQVAMLYSASFLTGLARSFSQPAVFAMVPRLVERSLLTKASAVMSSVMQIARIAGPAFGGLTFGFLGASVSSSIVCVLLVGASVSMILVQADIPPPEVRSKHASIKDEFLSGIKFVYNHSILFPAMTLDMISVMFGGVTALLPIFADTILHVGPKGLGALRAAPAIGATIMSLYLTNSKRLRSGHALLTAVGGFGVCILVFGLSHNFYLSIFALAVSGCFDSVSMVIRSSAVQLTSPDDMRGKISAVNSIFIGSSNEIGELESGIAAKLLGTAPAVYVGGLACLATVGFVGFLAPKLRKMNLDTLQEST